MQKLIDHPEASERSAATSTDQHEEVSAWKDDTAGEAVCGMECACGVTFDGFPSLAEARQALAAHIAQASTVSDETHPVWCSPSWCKLSIDGVTYDHRGEPFTLTGDAALEDRLVLQMWQPGDVTPEYAAEAGMPYLELRIVDHKGKTQYIKDLMASQIGDLRLLLAVVCPVGDQMSEESGAYWLGVEAAYEAGQRAIQFAANVAEIHLHSVRRSLRAARAEEVAS